MGSTSESGRDSSLDLDSTAGVVVTPIGAGPGDFCSMSYVNGATSHFKEVTSDTVRKLQVFVVPVDSGTPVLMWISLFCTASIMMSLQSESIVFSHRRPATDASTAPWLRGPT